MRGWIALFAWGALGCESTPPPTTVCVTTPAQGANLRVMAAYFVDRQLHEVADDVPIPTGEACLTLRPPEQVRAEHLGVMRVYVGQQELEFAGWPLDLAVYADRNRNGALDPGEVIHRRSAEGRGSTQLTWFVDFEALLESYLAFDPADDETLALTPFVLSGLNAAWPDRESRAELELEEPLAIDSGAGCAPDRYPGCIGRVVESDFREGFDFVAPGVVQRNVPMDRRLPVFDGELPIQPFACELYSDLSRAYFEFFTERRVDRCDCAIIEQWVTIRFKADDPPDWFECAATVDYR